MKTALISFTENGRKLSQQIAGKADIITAERYCFSAHSDDDSHSFDSLSELIAGIFNEYEAIVFVCACGIAVRAVAPYIRSKTSDPAVIVIDDCGRFAIPVLSGHIGGANALAERLAEAVGAQPVITTATDTGGHFSPDSFAAANSLIITDMDAAKAVAAAVLEGRKIGFVSNHEYKNMPDDISAGTGADIGIYVGTAGRTPFPLTLILVPKNIVLGIGCKRGTDSAAIGNAVRTALKTAGIAPERVSCAATIDLKANEEGLLSFCGKNGLKLKSYTAQELMETEGSFSASEFVQSVTGADNVCERSAVKCSGGQLILRKTALDGVTVAAAEIPLLLDFERRIL